MWIFIFPGLAFIATLVLVAYSIFCKQDANTNKKLFWANLAVALAALTAVLLSLSFDFRDRYLDKPKLSLSIDDRQNLIGESSLRCLIKVTNTSNREARNCSATLDIKGHDEFELCWYLHGAMNNPPLEKTINPQDSISLCIITSEASAIIPDRDSRAWVATQRIWLRYNAAYESSLIPSTFLNDDAPEGLRTGVYYIEIQLNSENGDPVTGRYKLTLGDDVSDFKIEEIE